MLPPLPLNPSSFVRVRDLSPFALPALASSLHLGGSSETRKTYRAVFSEPKVIIPSASTVQQLVESSDSVQTKSPGERLPEAEPAVVALPEFVTAEAAGAAQTDGRPSKRTRDSTDPDGTVGRPRKKKGKKLG
jgi:ribonuclease P/MRP protein subunit RPP1